VNSQAGTAGHNSGRRWSRELELPIPINEMTNNEYALAAVAITAAGVALFAWNRWSDADAVARYYRSDYYQSCMTAAAEGGATIELALHRCHDDETSVRISQSTSQIR
jgi:hypothetical protein